MNGEQVTAKTDANRRLVDFLREDLGLTGVKEGCGEGECGACTVLLDGEAVTSCTVMAGQVQGRTILTVEGLAEPNGTPCILQQAFLDAGAVQCGFCTPGMLLSAKALLMRNPHPSEYEIRQAISGNLCRCTGYQKIIKAIQLAAERGAGDV